MEKGIIMMILKTNIRPRILIKRYKTILNLKLITNNNQFLYKAIQASLCLNQNKLTILIILLNNPLLIPILIQLLKINLKVRDILLLRHHPKTSEYKVIQFKILHKLMLIHQWLFLKLRILIATHNKLLLLLILNQQRLSLTLNQVPHRPEK